MRNVIFLLIGKKRNHVTSYIEASAQVKYLGVILIAFLPSLPSPPSISESYWLYLQTHLNLVTSCHLHSYQYPHLLDFYSFLIDLLVSLVFQQSSPHCGRVVLQKCSLNDITPFFKTSLQLPIILKEKSQLLASAGPLPSYLALSSSPVPSLPTHSLHSRHTSLLEHMKLFTTSDSCTVFSFRQSGSPPRSSDGSPFKSFRFSCANVHSTKRPCLTI